MRCWIARSEQHEDWLRAAVYADTYHAIHVAAALFAFGATTPTINDGYDFRFLVMWGVHGEQRGQFTYDSQRDSAIVC